MVKRSIGREKYPYLGTTTSKTEAKNKVDALRKQGYAAEYRRNPYGFFNVYGRPKKGG